MQATRTIVIVDDEVLVRDVACAILKGPHLKRIFPEKIHIQTNFFENSGEYGP